MKVRKSLDTPTLFVIGVELAIVLACIVATLVVNGRIRRNLQAPEVEPPAESTAMVVHEVLSNDQERNP